MSVIADWKRIIEALPAMAKVSEGSSHKAGHAKEDLFTDAFNRIGLFLAMPTPPGKKLEFTKAEYPIAHVAIIKAIGEQLPALQNAPTQLSYAVDRVMHFARENSLWGYTEKENAAISQAALEVVAPHIPEILKKAETNNHVYRSMRDNDSSLTSEFSRNLLKGVTGGPSSLTSEFAMFQDMCIWGNPDALRVTFRDDQKKTTTLSVKEWAQHAREADKAVKTTGWGGREVKTEDTIRNVQMLANAFIEVQSGRKTAKEAAAEVAKTTNMRILTIDV